MSQTPTTPRKRNWPDMSAYGLHFGVLDMPQGGTRMVMVDQTGGWAELARRMGFSQSRWFGLYVKNSLKLDIPGFASQFPLAQVIQLTDTEIRDRVRPLILERRNQRLSQMAGGRRLSWHPHRTPVADAAAKAAGEDDAGAAAAALSPEVALRQTLLLGMNALGQEVYESGDGLRFVKAGDVVIARETSDGKSDPTFLRATTDDELVQVAAGMVCEIDAGRRLHSDDFIRYVDAVFGIDATEDKAKVGRFHAALDRAMLNRLTAVEGAGQDAFTVALRLHEGRPTFWRAGGTWSTPLPIAVVMQALVAARLNSSAEGTAPLAIIDISAQPESHSWSLKAQQIAGGDVPAHDIAVAGVFGQPSAGLSIGGVRVTRTDTETLLDSLSKRNPDGMSVFVVTTPKAGELDNEFRRALSAIGQRYEVAGLVDLDSSMIGPGSEQSSRLVVVGRKRVDQDFTYAVHRTVPVIYDYASLWNWSESVRAAQLGESQTFGDDGREENRWQAPYIPASQVSEPETMSPRNLLGPVRMALARIVDRFGMGIDEYVCSKLGWTMEQLEARLSSEQVDAVAIAVTAMDDNMAVVEADATGIGKGRVAAAMAVYARTKGVPVVFMTEKSDLFTDFYRDVEDIGCLDVLAKPFILNNDLVVRDAQGKEIARSPKREVSQMTMACGEYPEGYDVVMATYSQFNRIIDTSDVAADVAVARTIRALIRGEIEPFDALKLHADRLGLPDYAANLCHDAQAAITWEKLAAQQASVRHPDTPAKAQQHLANAELLAASKDKVLERLGEAIRADMTTLKHRWLYSGALSGALLVLDESHVAAGEASQTGVNLNFIKENAGALVYSSATFAKDIGNFALYSRLFPSSMRVATIGETLERGGEPMQEIVSGMLAKDGRLIRREHDLSNIEFKLSVDIERKVRNEQWSDALARVLSTMSALSGEVKGVVTKMNEAAEAALDKVKRNKNGSMPANIPVTGVQHTNFSSRFYNLSRAFMMAVNADQAADLAIKSLQEGRKPVITVENTMETVLKELIEGIEPDAPDELQPESFDAALSAADPLGNLEAGDLLAGVETGTTESKARRKQPDSFDLGRVVSFKDVLAKYVDTLTSARKTIRKGNKLVSSARITIQRTPEMEELVVEIKKLIDSMPEVPLSPMDHVRDRIAAAGFSVDEISGRRMRLVRKADGNHSVVRMTERKKQPLKSAFNNGTLDAILLSKSGSTGISLHASRTFNDQSQRELIELQPAAAIDQRMQFWGRVNRKGQVCTPIIHMVSSGLPAELRLITMQNGKLRKLSANISGNADNSAINDDAPDILNRIGNEVAYRWMEANPNLSTQLGYEVGEIEEEKVRFGNTKFVDHLTGRLCMLLVDDQRRVYREVTSEFQAMIEQCELEGRNPLKSTEYDIKAKKTGRKTLQVAAGMTSVFDEAVEAVELTYPIQLAALNKETILSEAAAGHQALVDAHGIDYAKKIGDACTTAMEASLPLLLPKRFTSIDAAIANDAPNAVKNAINKFQWLASWLLKVKPGSIVNFSDTPLGGRSRHSDANWVEAIYVTGWKVPSTNLLSMAEYKLVGYSERSRKRVEMSMSSLMTRPSAWVQASVGNDNEKSIKVEQNFFFEVNSKPISGHERRVVFEGNLYRAADIAENNRTGTAITYSDDRGVWHHAILMPKNVTLSNVMDFPVSIDNADAMEAAFNSITDERPAIVSDDMRDGEKTWSYRIYGSTRGIQVAVAGSKEGAAWLLARQPILDCCVNGAFQGSRGARTAIIMRGKEREFLDAFMHGANIAGAKVLLDGRMRTWYNDYLSAKVAPKADLAAVDAVLSTNDHDLETLLATP